jgi:triacylglycerol esterase/lipase EstA (alpha/beta hydrolase family)
MADMKKVMKDAGRAAGRAVVRGGVFVARKAAEGWKAIDPDVKRHIAQIPLLSYSLFVSRTEIIETGEPDGHPPLIFVHGLGGGRGDFLPMAIYMRHRGRRRSYRIHFDGGQTTEDMARALARFIRRVKKVTGEKQVEIVAHSLGGLIARMTVVEHRLSRSVKTLVTMGTPHKGTHSARFASTAKTLDLRIGSALIKRLNSKPWPRHIRAVSFWSKNDLFVLPPESAVLEGAEAVEMTPFTHYSYLIDPRAWAEVARTLGCA